MEWDFGIEVEKRSKTYSPSHTRDAVVSPSISRHGARSYQNAG